MQAKATTIRAKRALAATATLALILGVTNAGRGPSQQARVSPPPSSKKRHERKPAPRGPNSVTFTTGRKTASQPTVAQTPRRLEIEDRGFVAEDWADHKEAFALAFPLSPPPNVTPSPSPPPNDSGTPPTTDGAYLVPVGGTQIVTFQTGHFGGGAPFTPVSVASMTSDVAVTLNTPITDAQGYGSFTVTGIAPSTGEGLSSTVILELISGTGGGATLATFIGTVYEPVGLVVEGTHLTLDGNPAPSAPVTSKAMGFPVSNVLMRTSAYAFHLATNPPAVGFSSYALASDYTLTWTITRAGGLSPSITQDVLISSDYDLVVSLFSPGHYTITAQGLISANQVVSLEVDFFGEIVSAVSGEVGTQNDSIEIEAFETDGLQGTNGIGEYAWTDLPVKFSLLDGSLSAEDTSSNGALSATLGNDVLFIPNTQLATGAYVQAIGFSYPSDPQPYWTGPNPEGIVNPSVTLTIFSESTFQHLSDVVSLSISPVSTAVIPGDSTTFAAFATLTNGTTVPAAVAWQRASSGSLDTAFATTATYTANVVRFHLQDGVGANLGVDISGGAVVDLGSPVVNFAIEPATVTQVNTLLMFQAVDANGVVARPVFWRARYSDGSTDSATDGVFFIPPGVTYVDLSATVPRLVDPIGGNFTLTTRIPITPPVTVSFDLRDDEGDITDPDVQNASGIDMSSVTVTFNGVTIDPGRWTVTDIMDNVGNVGQCVVGKRILFTPFDSERTVSGNNALVVGASDRAGNPLDPDNTTLNYTLPPGTR